MSSKHLGIYLFFLVIALPSVIAAYQASANTASYDVCACSAITDSLIVVNTGQDPSGYAVILSGEASAFTTLTPDQFTLLPGKQQLLTTNIAVPCDVSPRTYGLSLRFIDNTGDEQVLKQTVSVKRCPNIGIMPASTSKTVQPCTEATFRVDITNTGAFVETYDLSIEPLTASITTSFNAVQIIPDGTAPLFIKAKPGCEITGAYNLTLTTYARNSKFLAETPLFLNIVPDYNVTIDIPEKLSVCEDSELELPVSLKNKMHFANAVNVTVSGPHWAQSLFSMALDPRDSDERIINFTPPKGSAGEYTLSIETITDLGHDRKAKDVLLTVDPCFGVDIEFETEKQVMCAGEELDLPFIVKNLGSEDQDISINLSAPGWASLDESFELDAGQETREELTLVPTEDAAGKTFDLKVTALNEDHPAYNDQDTLSITVISKDACEFLALQFPHKRMLPQPGDFAVKIYNRGIRDAAYDLSMNAPDWVSVDVEELSISKGADAWMTFTITPPNITGTFPINLSFAVDGKDTVYHRTLSLQIAPRNPVLVAAEQFFNAYWLYLGAGLIALIIIIILLMVLESSRKKKEAEMSREERDEEAASKAYRIAERFEKGKKFYNALEAYTYLAEKHRRTKAARDSRKRITAINKMFKQQAQPQKVSATKTVAKKVVRKTARPKRTKQKKDHSNTLVNIFLTFILIILIAGAIWVLYPKQTPLPGNETAVNVTILPPEEGPGVPDDGPEVPDEIEPDYPEGSFEPVEGITYRVWEQDHTEIINLSALFADPDADTLVFTHSEVENIDVEMRQGLAILTPSPGWYGTETVIFTADDGQGGVVDTPKFTLKVEQREGTEEARYVFSTLFSWIKAYASYIVLGIVILIILIGLLRILEQDK
ncbi:MAG: hypothetical protein ABIH34_04295 [Nanoarchaeota archaeon]